MANSHAELRSRYEDILRSERFNHLERISNAVDDYNRQSQLNYGRKDKGVTSGKTLTGWGSPRVRIGIGEIRSENHRLAQRLRFDPLRHIRAIESACHAIAAEERPEYDKNGLKIKVAIAGPILSQPLSPRSLTSSHLRNLVCVEGVATKVSAIKPKVVKSVHYCPKTSLHELREYIDATDPQLGLPALDASGRELPDKIIGITTSVYPTKDRDQNPLETEFGFSEYKDHQTIVLQEMPERAPMGQLPRSVELMLDHDLVDKIKPGDRVQIVGVYRALATSSSGQSSTSGFFRTVVLVNNVQILGRDVSNLTFAPSDIREIRNFSRRKDVLNVLGRSIAPSIHGHHGIKKALALQLLSGCEKNLDNGTHLRGDINILMVGDPSTAKSQLLRAAMQIAPLAISTTGKGSSGVGLTAAVTVDPDTRDRRLEAGAMVLADRGLVCIDEFDKMGEIDRVAIHEAMEQQTVTIAKAGIHASLNARCSVLAAANPVYGQYDRQKMIRENIGLPDSLLSRFDLLFVVLDQLDPVSDLKIATHVIRGHRSRPTTSGHESDDSDDEHMQSGVTNVWQRSHQTLADPSSVEDDDPHSEDVLCPEFLRKYLHFAKTKMTPTLTDGAREAIASRYAEMRSRMDDRTLPVTPRSLETIIRLASAHAKARLNQKVEAEPDVTAAMEILRFALYHEEDPSNREISTELPNVDKVMEDENQADDSPVSKKARFETDVDTNAMMKLKESIWNEITIAEGDAEIDDICKDVKDRDAIMSALKEMEAEERIYLSDGFVFIV